MIERAAILALVSVLIALAVAAVRLWSTRRVGRLRAQQSDPLWKALGESPDGRPSLVVFSTPGCTACRTVQLPAVEAVQARFGRGLRILKVDLSRRPAVGEAFKVLTAPTTVVLGADGRVGSVNQGFAPADRLSAQLSALGASPASPR
jgi:thioredoxin-like negative regulator of GroEL